MIKKEWQSLWKSTWFKVVLLAIVLIPTIYASVFLGSMWDPYGNASSIPVAIVNQDKEVIYNGVTLNIGNDLVQNLKQNKSMDFRFVDDQEANKGLENGSYYMKIMIPTNFSSNATTLLNPKPEKMVLEYTTNPGTNYIASKMDESAITKIKESVSRSVTKTYASTIFNQITTLSSGLKDASDGTNTLHDGVTQLLDGNIVITNNLDLLANSSLTFKDGTHSLEVGLQNYIQGVTNVNQGITAVNTGITALATKAPTIVNGLGKLQQGTTSLQDGTIQYTSGVTVAQKGTQELVKNNETLSKGMEDLTKGLATLNQSSEIVYTKLKQSSDDLDKKLKANSTNIATLKTANTDIITTGTALIGQVKADNTEIQTAIDTVNNSSLSTSEKEQILSALQASQTTNVMLVGDGTTSNPGVLSTTILLASKNNDMITQMKTSLITIKDGLVGDGTIANPGILPSMSTVNTNYQGIQQQLETNVRPSLQKYMDSVKQVNNGLTTITLNTDTLVEGSTKLNKGMEEVSKNVPLLTQGITTLQSGTSTLQEGTSALVENNDTLLKGVSKLSDGATQIHDGASQLSNGSSTLSTGLVQMGEGTTVLNSNLLEGANKSRIDVKEDMIDMLASPIAIEHQEISTVSNNGHAMAPYMMSVALYVAAMAFTLMYPLLNNIHEAKSGFKYWLSKASVMYSISTIQAIVMVAILMLVNGLQPKQVVTTFIFACLVSAAFMAMIVFLNITLGKIGSFLVLVFMVLQLGGAAGTYPLETSSAFYKVLHPLMPFSYSVNGFRHVLSMDWFASGDALIFFGILIVFSLLSICFYQYRSKHQQVKLEKAFD